MDEADPRAGWAALTSDDTTPGLDLETLLAMTHDSGPPPETGAEIGDVYYEHSDPAGCGGTGGGT